MKCKYKFPAQANVTFETGLRFDHNQRTYDLEVTNNELAAISVTVHNYPEEFLPTLTPLKNQLAKASINIPVDPFLDQIVEEVQAIEGGLCFWGLEEIDVDGVEREWIPESDEDTTKLQLAGYSARIRPRNERPKAPASMDIFIKTILLRSKIIQWEVPLNFYRRGRIDLAESRYIEAIYDTYFALETMFANGKFKSRQVINELLSSQELVAAIERLKNAPDHRQHCPPNLLSVYLDKFVRLSVEQIVRNLVETRGFLHHHTTQRRGMWHPAKQREYYMDAIIATNICTEVLLTRINGLLFDPTSTAELYGLDTVASDGRPVKWHGMSEEEFEEQYGKFLRI